MGVCAVCDASPVVLVALRHPFMRRWTEELLAAEHGCWDVEEMRAGELLVDAIARVDPHLVIVDDRDFPSCCRTALNRIPRERVMVVGPEPDLGYRSLALARGAGGWVSRDQVGERLSSSMRAALGCRHEPCPSEVPPAPGTKEIVLSEGPARAADGVEERDATGGLTTERYRKGLHDLERSSRS